MERIEVAVIGTGWCGGIRAETLSRSALVDKLHICEIRPDRLAEVKALTQPASATLDYQDILNDPNISVVYVCTTPEQNHYPITRDCLKAGKRCTAYSISVSQVTTHRVGNFWQFWLDMLNFRRRTVTTGWSFNALIIFVDDLAVFALAGGQPNINTEQFTRNPLGPLQGIGEALRPRIP